MHIIPFIQLPLQIRQPNQHGQVPPHVPLPQLQRLTDVVCGAELRARELAAADAQHPLALEAVEVFGEAAAVGLEEVPLDEKHEEGVELIERVEGAEEIAWVAVSCDGEEVAEGRGNERGQLLLR